VKDLPVSDTGYVQALDLAAGVFLLAAVGMLWRRELAAMIRLFALQGAALAAMVAILGLHEHSVELVAVAAGLGLLRAGVLPLLARRALGTAAAEQRETSPSVNIAASLLAAAALTLLSYVVTRPLVALEPSPATAILPVAVAVVLIGLFTLATRRRALSQVVGFLLLDNGITATAFLATAGVPLIVELGVSFDLLLVALVLQLLIVRVRTAFGTTDLDELRELHD
jgi:hydrogenase-4 component E